MQTGLKDIKGREIKIGDKFKFCYIGPNGECNEDDIDDGLFEITFEQGCVVARYISGRGVEDMDPKVLRNYMRTEQGRYICNYGPLTVYPDNTVYGVVID